VIFGFSSLTYLTKHMMISSSIHFYENDIISFLGKYYILYLFKKNKRIWDIGTIQFTILDIVLVLTLHVRNL
jgi:hypothetical protein